MTNGIVFIKDSRIVVTTSLRVAHYFEKEHKHVLRDIDNIVAAFKSDVKEEPERVDFVADMFGNIKQNPSNQHTPNFGLIKNWFIKGDYKDAGGRKRRMYYLTRDGFSMLIMGFTGSKARRIQAAFIEEFNRRGEELDRLLAEKYDAKRKAQFERYIGKYHVSMNAIKRFTNYAIAEGYSPASVERKFYAHINHNINQAVGIKDGTRPNADTVEYYRLREAHAIAARVINDGLRAEMPARYIYDDAIENIKKYGKMIRLAEDGDRPRIGEGGKDFFEEEPPRDKDYEFEPDAYDDDELEF